MACMTIRVKVLDFGLAKETRTANPSNATLTSAGRTEVGVVMGTPAYMSPNRLSAARWTSHGHLLAGHHAVRNGDRPAALPRAVLGGVRFLDPAGHPLGDHGRADRPARRSGTHHPALPGEGSAPARPDLSPDAEQEYFVDGITEEIINALEAQGKGDRL